MVQILVILTRKDEQIRVLQEQLAAKEHSLNYRDVNAPASSDESKTEALGAQKRLLEEEFRKRISDLQTAAEASQQEQQRNMAEARDTIEQLNKKLQLSQKQLTLYREGPVGAGLAPSENHHELRSLRELSMDQAEQIAVSIIAKNIDMS